MPYINGVYMSAPGVSVTVNDSSFLGQTSTGGLGLAFIGPAVDGEPNTALSFSNPAQAVATLKGGDGLQAVLNAFQGAGNTGLQPIQFIRPEQATQATSAIDNGSAVSQIALTTPSYGSLANDSKWQVQDGSTLGYKVSQGSDYVGPGTTTYATQSEDNINLPIITIYCTSTTPTVTITDASFEVLSGGTSLGSVTLDSTTTVQQLVNQLNQISTVTATVADPNPQDIAAALFDNLSASTIGTTSSAPTTLYGNVEAVVRWFNAANAYFTAVRQANATSLQTGTTWTYASGGTTPTAANTDWQNAYTTAQGIVGPLLIAPVSGSETIWVMNDTHCQYMASQGQPRRGYVGDLSSQTESTELTYCSEINSNRTTVVWPEQKGVDYNGNATTFAPYLVAPQIMGMRAATTPTESLTMHVVKSNGMGQTVTPSMVSQGLAGGLCVLYTNAQGQVVIAQDRTTWLQNTAYDKVENSTGLVSDIVTKDLNQTLTAYISQPMTQATVSGAQSALVSRLKYWYAQGYLAAAPKTSDVSLTGTGTQISGTASAAFDVPTNYIVLSVTPTAVSVSA